MTATASTPAAISEGVLSRVMPPIATTGSPTACLASVIVDKGERTALGLVGDKLHGAVIEIDEASGKAVKIQRVAESL